MWRRRDGHLEVVLVHRPHYDDWSLPKGKVDAGETYVQAAIREVREEASVEVQMGPELPAVYYTDHRGRPKVARYWAMTVVGGEAGADNEIDEVAWLPVADAIARLTYVWDAPVLERLVELDESGALD